jgi:hypothetical protein
MAFPLQEVDDNLADVEIPSLVASSSNHDLQAYDDDDELAWLQEDH